MLKLSYIAYIIHPCCALETTNTKRSWQVKVKSRVFESVFIVPAQSLDSFGESVQVKMHG